MGRPVGARNRVHRVAQRDRKHIAAVSRGAAIGRAFRDGFSPDERGTIAGYSPVHARRLLARSMENVGSMSEEDRERLKRLPPPAPEGTQRRRAIELRMAGMPFMDIADELGVPLSTAAGWVYEELGRLEAEEVRHVDVARQVELLRLDALLQAQWPSAMAGSPKAAEVVLKIMDRRARYLGLDAPIKVDLEHRIPELAAQYGVTEEEMRDELALVIKDEAT